MKIKDFIKDFNIKFEDDGCKICKVHEEGYKLLEDKNICPSCGKPIEFDEDFTVVSDANYVEDEHNINKFNVAECSNCGKHIALIPKKIIYNGNHDIYYTGVNNYLILDFKIDETEIIKNIDQYTKRIKEGEDLKSWNLMTWIKYSLEEQIAVYLEKLQKVN